MALNRTDVKYFKLAVGSANIGKETDMDISVKCPVCGDSRVHKNKKRLHLYTKNGTDANFVHCFNGDCPVHNKTVYSFLRDFFPALLGQYKRETFGSTMEKLANGESEDVFGQFKKETTKTADVLVHDLAPYLTPIEQKPEAIQYLLNRGINYSEQKYGKWYFGHQDLQIGDTLYKITNAVVIPLYYNGTMYGFYSRSILDKTFYTYMHDANIGFKVWNWFNVNKNHPVYIFESIFDSIASGLPNCIAAMGAVIPEDRLKELHTPVFVLDNDTTGIKNSIEYAKRGFQVYVQPYQYKEKDMNDMMLKHPDENVSSIIQENIFSGISAEIRLKEKL